ncbi:energy-coupling factor transporter transmembrane component T family protein [Actinomyces gaoshouyii]|uniref:Cobalt ECF transporter T component CbiQ n=1 Tax=Actinomyces gaoshouyii TaxID=1960083 RepID=A0A8H9H8D8_9ACTO|nr:CbiQ family ECF transporter T component [Actinomyces gaoshouyii]GGO96758.1 hypothetical protein GCM10011612_07730 [Actinomyces gaoshouyii]
MRSPHWARSTRRALTRTLADATAAASLALREGRPPHPGTSPPRGIDARCAVLLSLAGLIRIALVRSPITLAVIYASEVILARSARLPMGTFLRRSLLPAPLFTLAPALPAALSAVSPGPVLFALPGGLTVTTIGVIVAARLVERAACSLALVALLVMTTRWSALLEALTALRVPRLITTIASMAHRYLLVLLGVVADAIDARRSRTVRPRLAPGGTGAAVAHVGAAALVRAGALSEEVHDAMLARGFRGSFPAVSGPRGLGHREAVLIVTVFISFLLWGGLDVLAGQWGPWGRWAA